MEIIKSFFVLLFVFTTISAAYSQSTPKIITGKFNLDTWIKECDWKIDPQSSYTPSDSVINLLKPIVKEQKLGFTIFAGNWCKDCKSELPKIMSIANALGISSADIVVYGLDKDFYEPSFAAKRMQITKVPTLIITYQGEELSRIEEFPQKGSTWELDILRIFQ
ncbi:MAG TPA: thioredoxin family protein [Candidatus Kapabacteria bacterium]|nr:thioredoxin family protein [Candidatus Kapabacteria bacterium]